MAKEEFKCFFKMYRHKKGVALYDRSYGYQAAQFPLELNRTELRYAVSCNPDDGTPHIFRRKDFLLSQAGDPNEMFVDIRCPRNVRFDAEDADPRQWAHSTLPAERFFDLYEAEASGEVLGVDEG